MWLAAQGAYQLQHRDELRIPDARERLVQALASEAGLARNGRHAARASDVARRRGDQGRVAILERGFQVGGHVLHGLQTLCRVLGSRGRLGHNNVIRRQFSTSVSPTEALNLRSAEVPKLAQLVDHGGRPTSGGQQSYQETLGGL